MTKGAILGGMVAALAVYLGYVVLGESLGGRVVLSAVAFAAVSLGARRIESLGHCLIMGLAYVAFVAVTEVCVWLANGTFGEVYRPGSGGAFASLVLWIVFHGHLRQAVTGLPRKQS